MKNEVKYNKAQDLIGQTFNDGNLVVVDIDHYRGTAAMYKVICKICSNDKELFPQEYFISGRGSLKSGTKPCGCGKSPRWTEEQYIVRLNRAAKAKGFIIHGFAEDFHGERTKVVCECTVDNHIWAASISKIVNSTRSCPKCAINTRSNKAIVPEKNTVDTCTELCNKDGYEFLGFCGKYAGVGRTKIRYKCNIHGVQTANCWSFINTPSRCRKCWVLKQKESWSGFYGWYEDRSQEKDYLYILNFDNQYIKVGRSFDVDNRIAALRAVSGISNITKLKIYTGEHEKIYKMEQSLHRKLNANLYYHTESKWSTETFKIESLNFLYETLRESDYGCEEI